MEVTILLISFETYILSKSNLVDYTSVLMTNICNMFLTQCWRMKTSPRPFYGFNEMTI